MRQVALVSELVGRSQKARQRLGTGWRSIWNNPAFRRLYAWRLWLVCLQKTSDEDMAGSAACDRRDPPFLGGAGRKELIHSIYQFTYFSKHNEGLHMEKQKKMHLDSL